MFPACLLKSETLFLDLVGNGMYQLCMEISNPKMWANQRTSLSVPIIRAYHLGAPCFTCHEDLRTTVCSLFLRNGFWQISPQRDVVASWGLHNSVLSSFRAICRKRFHKISEPTVVFESVSSNCFHLRKIDVKFMHQNQQFSHLRNVKQGEIDDCLKKQWASEYILKMLLIESLWVKDSRCKVAKTFFKNGFLVHGLKDEYVWHTWVVQHSFTLLLDTQWNVFYPLPVW